MDEGRCGKREVTVLWTLPMESKKEQTHVTKQVRVPKFYGKIPGLQFLLPSEVVNGSALLWKCLISMMLWIKQHTVQFGSLHIHHMGHSQTCPVRDYDGAELNTYTVMTKSLK